jgi:hypothetical protein
MHFLLDEHNLHGIKDLNSTLLLQKRELRANPSKDGDAKPRV